MIDKKQVLHIAKLAKINLQEEEIPRFQEDLGSIFTFIEKLNEVDTKDVPPTFQVTGNTQIPRKDEVIAFEKSDALLSCSPHPIQDHQIKIPKIM